MASIAISASMQSACSSHHVINRQSSAPVGRSVCTFVAKQAARMVVSPKIEGKKSAEGQLNKQTLPLGKLLDKKMQSDDETDNSVHVKFYDKRWKNGTWDLNMFVKAGKMDWDGVIVAEAKRRKFLQLNPEVSTNQEPVLFRTSIIPWWAWITHSHLPEAELLNGRAAMVGFFMGYAVDALTGMNVVGQTGNFICKVGLFLTVLGVILFRRTVDLENLKSLADEATFYDKQWQASWQDQDASSGGAS